MSLRPIDLHAHIQPDIASRELVRLGALVFAATRSLEEAAQALQRRDDWTVWGVGCHPGLVGVQKAFDLGQFVSLTGQTPYVSEVGLDGRSRVAMELQRTVFEQILDVLQTTPRITSIHSYEATSAVLGELEKTPIRGATLHWWLGDQAETKRALELGCYFSINVAMKRRTDLLDTIPLNRILPETDHPFGDRRGTAPKYPGGVADVEGMLSAHYGLPITDVRRQTWANLREIVSTTATAELLPRSIRVSLASM